MGKYIQKGDLIELLVTTAPDAYVARYPYDCYHFRRAKTTQNQQESRFHPVGWPRHPIPYGKPVIGLVVDKYKTSEVRPKREPHGIKYAPKAQRTRKELWYECHWVYHILIGENVIYLSEPEISRPWGLYSTTKDSIKIHIRTVQEGSAHSCKRSA